MVVDDDFVWLFTWAAIVTSQRAGHVEKLLPAGGFISRHHECVDRWRKLGDVLTQGGDDNGLSIGMLLLDEQLCALLLHPQAGDAHARRVFVAGDAMMAHYRLDGSFGCRSFDALGPQCDRE